MNEGFAAGDGYDRRAALVDGIHGLLNADALVEDIVRIVDLAATGAGQIASKQWLEHQHQGIALVTPQLLAQNVHPQADLLLQRNAHAGLLLACLTCLLDDTTLVPPEYTSLRYVKRFSLALQPHAMQASPREEG